MRVLGDGTEVAESTDERRTLALRDQDRDDEYLFLVLQGKERLGRVFGISTWVLAAQPAPKSQILDRSPHSVVGPLPQTRTADRRTQ